MTNAMKLFYLLAVSDGGFDEWFRNGVDDNIDETFVNQIDSFGNLILDNQQQLMAEATGNKDGIEAITTRKLICWSFQIARGMEYLGTKKVM